MSIPVLPVSTFIESIIVVPMSSHHAAMSFSRSENALAGNTGIYPVLLSRSDDPTGKRSCASRQMYVGLVL